MKRFVVRDKRGQTLAIYDNISEVKTYLDTSFPGSNINSDPQDPEGSAEVVNDKGEKIAKVDAVDF